ncbi:MAG: phosphoribosylglycinamide formyltransferase [Marinoscillum sp.]|uniref:phosphoribosylglycinamide formyltransferase n=1 Tax=Marinoscillum sp. TaxID=2024838 RepID=UPI0033030D9B
MDLNIAIFASGSGTNAEQLVKHFSQVEGISTSIILSNKPDAFVLERARKLGIPTSTFSKSEFTAPTFLSVLESHRIDYIILAGFLWKIPAYLIQAFENRIINIHPSLLPKYGGKGMYGSYVHEAVIAQGEKTSGITIHLVNEKYDDGRILFQASCDLSPEDTPDTLASKIHTLEHQYFPQIVEDYIRDYTLKT